MSADITNLVALLSSQPNAIGTAPTGIDRAAPITYGRFSPSSENLMQNPGVHSSLKEMLNATAFVVEATDFERHTLWREHRTKVKWEDIPSGYLPTIGQINGMPVTLSVFWGRIEGRLVMFYHACSMVVDYRMVNEWLATNIKLKIRNNMCLSRTDATNFHICLQAIAEMNAPQQAADTKSSVITI